MKKIVLSTVISIFTAILCASVANAQELPLEQCQNLADRIEDYDLLRKRGGTAEEMERWRQSREKLKKKFRDNDCRKWGKELD